jgi:hypothetical protein
VDASVRNLFFMILLFLLDVGKVLRTFNRRLNNPIQSGLNGANEKNLTYLRLDSYDLHCYQISLCTVAGVSAR